MQTLTDVFQRVYVINLARRRDRWDAFFKRIPTNWPFRFPEKYKAIDGGLALPPDWWRGGDGAWGCYKTHLRIMEDCLSNEVDSVLILEDDAVFVDDFNRKVKTFWEELPSDWEMVYLGGQHIQETIRLPRRVNERVYRPFNVNRCHAYGFRNRNAIAKAYRHLNDFANWNVDHHVDHYLGELHKKMKTGLYCPREWLVAQSEGASDICGANLELRLFPSSDETVYPAITQQGIAVLGDYFGGTNTVAGLLYHLGINVGVRLPLTQEKDLPQFFEDQMLGEICRQCYDEPWLTDKLPFEDRANHLRRWAGWQCKYSTNQTYFAGKHPILSLMGEEILETWPDPFFIAVDRPVEESGKQLQRLQWAWHPGAVKYAFKQLRDARETFLSRRTPRFIRLSFPEILDDPDRTIETLCGFLGYAPNEDQKENALRFLRSSNDDYVFGFVKFPPTTEQPHDAAVSAVRHD